MNQDAEIKHGSFFLFAYSWYLDFLPIFLLFLHFLIKDEKLNKSFFWEKRKHKH